jgi:hypothetical protein
MLRGNQSESVRSATEWLARRTDNVFTSVQTKCLKPEYYDINIKRHINFLRQVSLNINEDSYEGGKRELRPLCKCLEKFQFRQLKLGDITDGQKKRTGDFKMNLNPKVTYDFNDILHNIK